MDEPRIRVSIERRFNVGRYEYETVSIALSSLPYSASDLLIQEMLTTAERAAGLIRESICERIAQIRGTGPRKNLDPEAFRTPEASSNGELVSVDLEAPIPHDCEVDLDRLVFGVTVPLPPSEWLREPITEVNSDGNGSGQLTAINAALTSAGYGGKLRHPAALAILRAFGPLYDASPRETVGSIRDLSKAEAHIVLTWIERAVAPHLGQLAEAVKEFHHVRNR
jgi:hypothetical protein